MPNQLQKNPDVAHFYLRRLHSLLGVIPVSAFLVEHMIANSFILKGPEAYNSVIQALRSLPFLVPLEILLIGFPLAYHSVYGIYITLTGSANTASYSYLRNWMYVLQRVSGIIALVFIAYHVWEFRIASDIYGFEVSYEAVSKALANPWNFAFYSVGLAGTMFHFANGLWLFCITWGITLGPKSQRIAGWIFAVAGLVFFVLAMQTIWAVVQ
ncbi:MAG: succinate dehydrogenase cytochrome b558 subunit [Candidatus Omnitrophica bacterium]|nr:succinate dehydrogenase cytochrome b558 subunit [Candidatus Omnitrophota bacterium]